MSAVAATPRRTCYLHIGLPKTGTTCLQASLAGNREWLAERGLSYPRTGCGAPDPIGHHALASALGFASTIQGDQDNVLPALQAELRSVEGDCLISSEEFSKLLPAADGNSLRRLLRGFRVKVVAYLRRQDEWAASLYGQVLAARFLKDANLPRFLPFLRRPFMRQSLDFLRPLEFWGSVFGANNVLVRGYGAETLRGGDIITDFFSLLDLSENGQFVRAKRVNHSLPVQTVEALRLASSLPIRRELRRQLREAITSRMRAATGGEGLRLRNLVTAEHQAYIRNVVRDSNAALLRSGFDTGGVDLGRLLALTPFDARPLSLDDYRLIFQTIAEAAEALDG